MALINCKECEKQISDSAKRCPHCGCVTQFGQKAAQVNGMRIALLICCVAALIGIFLAATGYIAMLEGIDNYDGFSRWLSRDDEAGGIFIKFCVGLGILIGCVLIGMRIRRQAGSMQVSSIKVGFQNPRIPDELFNGTEEDASFDVELTQNVANGWRCVCGRVNAGYVSSCCCGKSKREQ